MTTEFSHYEEQSLEVGVERIARIYSERDKECFSEELLAVLRTLDMMKILDETRNSGPGTLREVLDICMKLGKIDASLAWIVGVSNSAWSMRSNYDLDENTVSTMSNNKILAMVLGRPGLLKWDRESNTYLLNGEWKYASGWQYSSFFFCVAALEENKQDIRMVVVPAELLEISEEWQATGLRATQSATVRAKNIQIAGRRMVDYTQILLGNKVAKGSFCSYSGFFTGVLMCCLIGSILGATEAALDYVVDTVNKSPVLGSTYALMSDSGAIRAELGRLRSMLDMYKRAAEYNAEIIDKAAREESAVLSTQDRVDNRGRATLVMRGCVNIVQDLLWVYGASGLNQGSFLEKIWRDVNVGARHGGFSKLVPEEAVGLSMIGRNPRDLTQMF